MVEYLIKFVSKKRYAEDILDGKLFMRCAKYYHELERRNGPGQGDLREGSIIPGIAMYKNIALPIYCLYTVEEEDIVDNLIRISKRVVKDFGCENGYLVLIPYDQFKRVLPLCNTSGYAMGGGRVIYGTPSHDLSLKLFSENDAMNLFIKDSFFSHQKEYRLVVYKKIPEVYTKMWIGNIEQNVLDVDQMNITYLIPGGLRKFAKSIAITSLASDENDYLLAL